MRMFVMPAIFGAVGFHNSPAFAPQVQLLTGWPAEISGLSAVVAGTVILSMLGLLSAALTRATNQSTGEVIRMFMVLVPLGLAAGAIILWSIEASTQLPLQQASLLIKTCYGGGCAAIAILILFLIVVQRAKSAAASAG